MADILFFEKPGCINGEKQKKILHEAGHVLTCSNILEYPWTREELLLYVEGKAPSEIMNYTAPDIKNKTVVPEELSFDEAVELMLGNPILIKRPLVEVEGKHLQGFLDKGLQPYLGEWNQQEDVVTCPNLTTISCDEQKG